MKRSKSLLVSTVLLALLGIQGAIGIPAAFVSHDHGQFTRAVQIGSGAGAVFWTAVWFGLAYLQWTRIGAWGRRVGVLALAVMRIQSALTYLAMSRGRIPIEAATIVRFAVFTLAAFLLLSISSFASYAEFRKKA